MMGIENPTAKNGKYMCQTGAIVPYSGGKTKKGSTTPTGKQNSFQYEGGLEGYKKAWSPFLDLNQFGTVKEAQGAVYDYLLKNGPQVLQGMWQEFGNTAQGLNSGVLTDKYKTGDFSGAQLSQEELAKLKDAYADNLLGARTLTPNQLIDVPNSPVDLLPPTEQPPAQPRTETTTTYDSLTSQPRSRFNEPLHWFDVAGPIAGLLEGRIPAKYNPVEFNQVRLKQQNPLPALQQGERDYNSIIDILPQNSQGFANAANIYSKKYAASNQILGQYENINSQIKNQETLYNANVRDRQSLADQQAREVFERKYLMSKEALRQQRAQSFDELYTRMAQNRKLNREGILLMQLFPAFDQYAQFNGYQIPLRNPLSMPQPGVSVPVAPPTGKAPVQSREKSYVVLPSGKTIYFTPSK
jgi:hypothetical protein